ncbi:MAG: hypothetical protein ACXVIG_07765, partial [Halobacteriota archaeon]
LFGQEKNPLVRKRPPPNIVQTSGDAAFPRDKKSTITTIVALEARRPVESIASMEGEEAFLAKFQKKVCDKVEVRITP